jgi:dienelactone hydrolase
MARRLTLLAMVAALVVAPPAAGQLPWPADDVDSRVRAEGRGIDQAANLAYQRAKQSGDGFAWVDPFRRDWSGTRGERVDVRFANRYGAMLAGHMYRPLLPWADRVTGRQLESGLPAVVIVPGLGNWDTHYASLAQQIAENGYVVLAIEPQGQHLSEDDPNPRDAYCGPGGQWREPQEAGLAENGDCAGHDPPHSDADLVAPELRPVVDAARGTPAYEPLVVAALLLSVRSDPAGFRDRIEDGYRAFRARFTFAGIDAADWLVSSANPWRSLVDGDRIGIAGHSAGGDAAIVAGNAHRRGLFRAVVAWDSYGTPPVVPKVPTMIQQSEQASQFFPWGARPPDPEFWPSYRTLDRFTAAGVPAYLLALRGSTHQEWPWIPDALSQPLFNASAKGQQVALYFTVAWFDRWLKGRSTPSVAEDARRRLVGASFDDSADRTSIGQGTYDPATDANVPYRIGGELVGAHLSRLFRTKLAFEGLPCFEGCAAARRRAHIRLSVRPPTARAARRTRFRFHATYVRRGDSRPLRGVTIRFAGRRARTDRTGRAAITARLAHPGLVRVRATKRGYTSATRHVRVRPRRQAAR